MNRQARFLGFERWTDYGDVTHSRAAQMHAEWAGVGGQLETRDEVHPETVFRIAVTKRCEYIPKCLRHDEPGES